MRSAAPRRCDLSARHPGRRRRRHDHLPPDRAPTPTSSTSWRCRSPSPSRRARRPAATPAARRPPARTWSRRSTARELRLVRNPHFRRRSTARPDGYPDAINIRFGVRSGRGVRAVERGRADFVAHSSARRGAPRTTLDASRRATPDSCTPTPARVTDLHVPEHAHAAVRQRRRAPRAELRRRPPRRRRARGRGAASRSRHARSCRRTSPATGPTAPTRHSPGAGRPWSRARPRAGAAPGRPLAHARMRVTLVAGRVLRSATARLMRTGAQRARIQATLHLLPGANYFAYVADSRHRAQIGADLLARRLPGGAASPDCSSAARVHPGARSVNYSEFCDPPRRPAHATRAAAAGRRIARRRRAWARADRRVVDQAAAVPLTNRKSLALVSRRVGNYQYSQQWGVLYDQLWVR